MKGWIGCFTVLVFFHPLVLAQIELGPPVSEVDLKELGLPQDIVYHPARGTLLIVSKDPAKVTELDLRGNPVGSFETSDFTDTPEGIVYDPFSSSLLIVKGDSKVYRVDSEGILIEPVPFIDVPLQIDAEAIAVHPLSGHFFIADRLASQIIEVDREGQLIGAFSTAENGLVEPQGLAFYGLNLLIEGKVESERVVLLFEPDGRFLRRLLKASDFGLEDPEGITVIGQSRICMIGETDQRMVCSDNQGPFLVVPYSAGVPGSFVGFSVLNKDEGANGVSVFGYDRSGNIIAFDEIGPVNGLGQSSLLTSELFLERPGTTPTAAVDTFQPGAAREDPSWPASLMLRGEEGPVQGFFMIGDSTLARLDGIGAELRSESKFYLPVAHSTGTAETRLFFFNPSPDTGSATTIELFSADGILLNQYAGFLPPFGSFQPVLGQLFDPPVKIEEGYFKVAASEPLIGFESLADEETFSLIGAQLDTESRKLYSPHFFVGPSGAGTVLRLINTGALTVTLTVTAYDGLSNALGSSTCEIEPGALLVKDLVDVLGIDSGQLTETVQGFLEIDSHGPVFGPFTGPAQVVGMITFSSENGKSKTTLPVLNKPGIQTVFSHVAHSRQSGITHGLAVLNPQTNSTTFSIQTYDQDGQMTRSRSIELQPRQRLIGMLDDPALFGPDFEQIGGHLTVASEQPLFVISILVGERFLTALEGQPSSISQ